MRKVFGLIGFALAFLTGALPAFLVIMIVFADIPSVAERLFTFALVIVAYGLIGLAFGLMLPGASWRSGIWVSIPVLIVTDWYSIQEPGYIVMHLFYLLFALSAACCGAGSGALLAHRRQKQ